MDLWITNKNISKKNFLKKLSISQCGSNLQPTDFFFDPQKYEHKIYI